MRKLLFSLFVASLIFASCSGNSSSTKNKQPLIDSSKAIGIGVNGQSSNTEGANDTSTRQNTAIDSGKKKTP